VNVGIRQRGRLRAASVIDCPEDAEAIIAAIEIALSFDFLRTLKHVSSPYGDGHAVPQITSVLADPDIDPHALLTKPFFDVPLPVQVRPGA
jgi:UDP-N-acetylglucosamine 2-epimerase